MPSLSRCSAPMLAWVVEAGEVIPKHVEPSLQSPLAPAVHRPAQPLELTVHLGVVGHDRSCRCRRGRDAQVGDEIAQR